MESFYNIIAVLTAGIALATGFFCLLTFLHKGREKVNLVFGGMCLSIVVFILLPPVGFFLYDIAPHSAGIKIKWLFHLSFIALFPWYIVLYTGFKKKLIHSIRGFGYMIKE